VLYHRNALLQSNIVVESLSRSPQLNSVHPVKGVHLPPPDSL
jgi:hypothetical protein